jgi:hypothetical protein
MGGSAFKLYMPPLNTPRMSLDIYTQVLQRTLALLQKHYQLCASPIEAPGKTTFGDVDILVALPFSETYNPFVKDGGIFMVPVAHKLKLLLYAEALITTKNNPTIHFAIPWPNNNTPNSEEKDFVQIDVHHLRTKESHQWELFRSAHGDLWTILGGVIRPFGLTANDVGLYLRIPEIETLNKKKSLIFLTSDPKEVLDLLGLEVETWWKQFESQEKMFQYASTTKLFWIKEETNLNEGDVLTGVNLEQEDGDAGKKELKHSDRQKLAKRPVFKTWMEEFIPRLREQGGSRDSKFTRTQIRDEAFEKFGVKEVYETRLKEWQLSENLMALKRDIRGKIPPVEEIPEGHLFRAAAIRKLTRVITDGAEFDDTYPRAAEKDENGLYDLDKVKSFVTENWRRAGELEMARQAAWHEVHRSP